MGLFGSVFGSGKKKQKSESSTHQVEDSTKTGTATNTENQSSVTTSLDSGVLTALSGFVKSSLRRPSQEQMDLRSIGDTLTTTAEGAAVELTNQVTDILNEARRSGEREVQRLQTDVAQTSGGSTDNTFVLQATAEAQAGLESQLAALGGQMALQIHQMQGQDFQNAVAALTAAAGAGQQNAQSLAYLVDALKGGKTASTAKGTSKTISSEEINSVIDALTKNKGSATDGKGLLSRVGESFSSFPH